jgi:hypothetical protein
LRQLGQIDFLSANPTQTDILVEYEPHNLSDADFTFSGPSLAMVETVSREARNTKLLIWTWTLDANGGG